ncbi:MAG: hypothetical protein ABUJ98_15940 [Hyphomicrobium sp.]
MMQVSDDYIHKLEADCKRLRLCCEKLNAIRNSIVGRQGFNFSEHAYPMVAALNEAGLAGQPYPEAKENLGTLIEQRDKAEAKVRELREQVEVERHCRLANEQEMVRAGGIIGELREHLRALARCLTSLDRVGYAALVSSVLRTHRLQLATVRTWAKGE